MTKFFGTVATVVIGAIVLPSVASLLGSSGLVLLVAGIVIARLLVWTVDR